MNAENMPIDLVPVVHPTVPRGLYADNKPKILVHSNPPLPHPPHKVPPDQDAASQTRIAEVADAGAVACLVHGLLDELWEGRAPDIEALSCTAAVVFEDQSVIATTANNENQAAGILTLHECGAIHAGGKFGGFQNCMFAHVPGHRARHFNFSSLRSNRPVCEAGIIASRSAEATTMESLL